MTTTLRQNYYDDDDDDDDADDNNDDDDDDMSGAWGHQEAGDSPHLCSTPLFLPLDNIMFLIISIKI